MLLRRELQLIRERGYAIDESENEIGVCCVAAPVFDHHGQVLSAISVAGPITRLTRCRVQALVPVVLDVANELSRRCGYPGSKAGISTEANGGPATVGDGPLGPRQVWTRGL